MNTSELPLVYFILLHWKDYDDTKACILSLKKITYPNYRIIVVDNHSDDASIEALISELSDVQFVLNDNNYGFSKGCNAGLKVGYESGADYLMLLNNDMVVTPGFLEEAVGYAEKHADTGAITGKIMYQNPSNVFWQAGGHIDLLRVQGIPHGKGEVDKGQFDEICETGWASGAMSLLPRKTIEKVGYLPEEYFFGQEEWDYSTAILKAGLKIYYLPTFKAFHKAGGSYKPGHPVLNVYGGYINKMIYAEKYMSPFQFKLWRILFFLYIKLGWPRLARKSVTNKPDYDVYIKAANLAFSDHKRIKRVGLSELQNAAKRLGSNNSWGNLWQS